MYIYILFHIFFHYGLFSSVQLLSRVRFFATPWTVAYQAPLSVGFSRQEDWSGLPSPSPGDLPDPGIKSRSSALQTDALPSELPGKPHMIYYRISNIVPCAIRQGLVVYLSCI